MSILSNYKIMYGSAATTLRVEIPFEYAAIATPTLDVINSASGTALLDGGTATGYTATTLGAAASHGENTITLASGASTVNPGDLLKIAAGASGPAEMVRAKAYNTSTRVVTLVDDLAYDHASGAAVVGRWLTYSLNASNTTTFPADIDLVVKWYPNAVDLPLTQRGELLKQTAEDLSWEDFRDLYKHYASEVPEGAWALYKAKGYKILSQRVAQRGRDINKVVAITDISDVWMEAIAWHIAAKGGDTWSSERTIQEKEFSESLDRLLAHPLLWIDSNQDNVEDDQESHPTPVIMGRNL